MLGVGGVDMYRDAGLRGGVAAACDRRQPIDEVRGRIGNREWIPTQLIGRRGYLVERAAAQQSTGVFESKGLCVTDWANPIRPRAAIERLAAR